MKGIVAEDHPLFLGVASGMAIDRDILETIRSADLVIGIGFDPVECDKTWFAKTEIVAIDSVSMAEGDYHPQESIGNIMDLLATLNDVAPKPWPSALIESRRAAIRRQPASGLSPLRVIEELRAIFPRDGIVTCDVGSHKLAMGQFWTTYQPGTFFMSNGLSGMGFGIPAAIAAQLAHPERQVLTVVGDGGMLMMLHDLALIRELALPIKIVVFTDRSLSLIRVSEHRRGIAPYGVDFEPPDFATIGEAFGIPSPRVTNVADLRSAFERLVPEHAVPDRRPDRFSGVLRIGVMADCSGTVSLVKMPDGTLIGSAAGILAAAGAMGYAVRGRSSRIFAPSLHHGDRSKPALALTFDDGPSESTSALLDILAQHSVRATFFMCGQNVRRLPQIARQVAAAGHEIGNHTDSHPRLSFIPPNSSTASSPWRRKPSAR